MGSEQVSVLLDRLNCGDTTAFEPLVSLTYQELRRIAGSLLRNQGSGHTLPPTALVNEAYLKLASGKGQWESRAHFFLSPVAGVLVDRWNRHRTLVGTQILSMLQSFARAALALSGVIRIWEVVALVAMQGFINAFDMPVRQSFVVEMIERREDLGNAIALNSSIVNGARLAGPAIAGMVIAAVGEGYCFLIDGFSYMAVIGSLLAMRLAAPARPEPREISTELREGWQYVSQSVAIRSVLLFLGLVSLVGMPYTVLMPIFAGPILHGGAHTLGFLMASAGVGALAGAIALAMRRSVLGLGRVIIWSGVTFGAGLMGLAAARITWLSMVCTAVAGFGMMRHMAASNTILQTIVEENKRGRVMAYYSLAIQGIAPFGSLAAGAAAFARYLPRLRQAIRPIYRELGILPAAPPAEVGSD
jgi:MFS family permease